MSNQQQKVAFITGITGQDGSYLAEFLLSKGYEVHGMIRRSSAFNTGRIDHIYSDPHDSGARLRLWYGDLSDNGTMLQILHQVQPSEIYNLGAQSHVRVSFDVSEYTANVVGLGTLRLLEAIRHLGLKCKFYQASSSEMFGASRPPQNEETTFWPRSPYAVSKIFAHHMAMNYREAYGMFVCCGILFNHESGRRGATFVTRKITTAIARILAGKQNKLYLGNLDSRRDWGYAPEYVEAMWRMLQQERAEDFVIATGHSHSIREFLDRAFGLVNLNPEQWVAFDSRYVRPTEVEDLIGDASRAKAKLQWEPKVKFEHLVEMMLIDDLLAEGLDPTSYGLPRVHPLMIHFPWIQDRQLMPSTL